VRVFARNAAEIRSIASNPIETYPINPIKLTCLLALLLCCTALRAQSPAPPHAVPLSSEPSHHLVFENGYVRAFNVAVAAHESTLLHQHDLDYLYVILGPADVTNAVLGQPEVRLQFADAELHFSRGPFAHVARNEAGTPFRNVTIELVHPQGAARNLCGKVLPEDRGPCPEAQAQTDKTTSESPPKAPRAASRNAAKSSPAPVHHSIQPWFETSEIVVNFASIDATYGIRSSARVNRLLVALEQAELEVTWPHKRPRLLHPGDVRWIPADADATVANLAPAPSRFLLIYFKD
jgi:hypothetical protein